MSYGGLKKARAALAKCRKDPAWQRRYRRKLKAAKNRKAPLTPVPIQPAPHLIPRYEVIACSRCGFDMGVSREIANVVCNKCWDKLIA